MLSCVGKLPTHRKRACIAGFAAAFVLFGCPPLAMPQSRPAADQSEPPAGDDAVKQISSLLDKIETALGNENSVSSRQIEWLVQAEMLSVPSSSGRELLAAFPERLEKHAIAQRDVSDAIRSDNFRVVAEAVRRFISDAPGNGSAEPEKTALTAAAPSVAVESDNTADPGIAHVPAASAVAPAAAPPIVAPAPITAPPAETPALPPAEKTIIPPAEKSAPAPATPVQLTMPLDVQRALVARGDKMLDLGDVAASRLLYARAAQSGMAAAARKLASTYDPAFLQAHLLRGIKGDAGIAQMWNQKAAELERTHRAEAAPQTLTNAASTR